MKFKIFNYEITISKVNELQKKGNAAKRNKSVDKIKKALSDMDYKQIKYSEYALQKESGLSINTIKKYRSVIEDLRGVNKSLFD